jgi:Uma2 family endonuclease
MQPATLETLIEEEYSMEDFPIELDITHLETENDEPLENTFAERQHRLLADTLYSSGWKPATGDTFLALANVGVFYSIHEPAIVPDVLLSIGVKPPVGNIAEKPNRAYLVWEYGKAPDVVVEIVSNTKGNELGSKLSKYAFLHIPYRRYTFSS